MSLTAASRSDLNRRRVIFVDDEPFALEVLQRVFEPMRNEWHMEFVSSGADALVIVTEWQEFRSPDFDTIRDRLTHPVVFDGRNIYEPSLVKSFGLKYHGIGRVSA